MAKKQRQLTAAEIAAQNEAMEAAEIQRAFEQGTNTLRDLISPSAIEIHSDYFRLGNKYGRTLYVYGYPRSLYTGWLSPIINIDEVIDMASSSAGSSVGTGGMTTKLVAGKIATLSGADMIIANSDDLSIIHRILDGEFKGTVFESNYDEYFDVLGYIEDNYGY